MYQIQQIHSTNENVYNTDNNVYTFGEMKKKQQQEKSAQKKHTN